MLFLSLFSLLLFARVTARSPPAPLGPLAPPIYQRCLKKTADVFFVVDTSSSLKWGNNVIKELDFVGDVIKAFDLGKDKMRTGMMTFTTNTEILYQLDDFKTEKEIAKLLDDRKIFERDQWKGGNSNIGKALRLLIDEGLSMSRGSRTDVPQIAVILTDGDPNDRADFASALLDLRKTNIIVFAIGVGRDRNHEKMLKIAGDPERVFELKDYDSLRAIRKELVDKLCDKEQSVGRDRNHEKMLKIAGDPERVFEKKDYDNLRAIREELVDKFCDKEQSVGRDRNHEKMLKIAGDPERVFEKKDYDNLRAIREELVDKFCDKEQSVGRDRNHEKMLKIAGDPERVFEKKDYDNLRAIREELVDKFCDKEQSVGRDRNHEKMLKIAGDPERVFEKKDYDNLRAIREELVDKFCDKEQSVGRDRNHEKMLKIAGDPERVFEKKDYDNLRAIREELINKFCDKEQSVGRDRNHEKMLKIAGDPERVFEKKDYDNLRAIREELVDKFCDKEQSVGRDRNHEKMLKIAGNPERVFEKKDYDNLRAIRKELVDKFCDKEQKDEAKPNPCDKEKPCEGAMADVIFVADSSRSLGVKEFDKLKLFAKAVVKRFTVSPNDIQVGFINFGKRSKYEFKLNSYRDQNEVMKAISKVQYLDDRERMQLTFTGKALQMLKQEGFKKRNGGRGGKVPKIAIIITDGEPTDIVATHRLAKEAKQQGIIIFAIGVGKWLQPDELHLLASDPKTHHAFMVDSYDKLSFIEDTLAKKTCTAACFSSDINATR